MVNREFHFAGINVLRFYHHTYSHNASEWRKFNHPSQSKRNLSVASITFTKYCVYSKILNIDVTVAMTRRTVNWTYDCQREVSFQESEGTDSRIEILEHLVRLKFQVVLSIGSTMVTATEKSPYRQANMTIINYLTLKLQGQIYFHEQIWPRK